MLGVLDFFHPSPGDFDHHQQGSDPASPPGNPPLQNQVKSCMRSNIYDIRATASADFLLMQES